MKNFYFLLFAIFSLGIETGNAQCTDCYAGGHPSTYTRDIHKTANINGSLSQSYLLQNVCGLNYTQVSVLTTTRTAAMGFNYGGTGFPTTLGLNGLPSLHCATVVKAFLYYGCTYIEGTPPATTATITNPNLTITTLPATMCGTTYDNICWGGNGSATYRVDVTSLISGNGNYTVDLGGFALPNYEVDGVTLLVIYSDPSASYSGSIALNDGDLSNDDGSPEGYTASGFNVCNATTTATAFTLLADVQANTNGGINQETYNGSPFTTFPNNFWNYCNVPVHLTSGQSTLNYIAYINNTTDCFFIAVAGLYWQNTNCTTCTPVVTTMTLTTASSPNTCINTGSASVNVIGGTGPLTYSWSPSYETTDTATNLVPGIYTVSVYDGSTCAYDTVTVGDLGLKIKNAVVNQHCTTMGRAGVHASSGFPPYTYLWTPGGQTNAMATGLSAGIYTVSVTDNSGCNLTHIDTIINAVDLAYNWPSPTPQKACPPTLGTANVWIYGGNLPYTYLWLPGGQTTATITGMTAGTYTFAIADSNGCSATSTTSVAYDSAKNLFNEPICIATIDTVTGKAVVIWGRTNSPPQGGFGSYHVFRDTGTGFALADTQPLNVLSEYTDLIANPANGPISYELSTEDSCAESALSAKHTTIWLKDSAATNVNILKWTAYVGFTPSKYRIFRGLSIGNLSLIDSVANTILTYHDTLPPVGSIYIVEAVSSSIGCIPTAKIKGHNSLSVSLSGSFSNGYNTTQISTGVINTMSSSNLSTYPNPGNGIFTVSYTIHTGGNVRILIADELGQVVFNNSEQKNAGNFKEQINLESLASGIYSLRLQTDNGITVQKLVIMNNR